MTEHHKDIDLTGLEELTGAKLSDEGAWFKLTWDNGDSFCIHRSWDAIHFDYLDSQNGKHRLKQLVACLPAFFRERGITEFRTTESGATNAMLGVGFQFGPGATLVCPIHEGGRMDEYTAWKRGEAPEPVWRA